MQGDFPISLQFYILGLLGLSIEQVGGKLLSHAEEGKKLFKTGEIYEK